MPRRGSGGPGGTEPVGADQFAAFRSTAHVRDLNGRLAVPRAAGKTLKQITDLLDLPDGVDDEPLAAGVATGTQAPAR